MLPDKPPLDDDLLVHFGVKGMKWGVRKARVQDLKHLGPEKIVRKTKTGETLTLEAIPPNRLHKTLAFISGSYVKQFQMAAQFNIHGTNGERIGQCDLVKQDDKLYLNMLYIEKSARGRGYATEILKSAEKYGKTLGVKEMTLHVPESAKDAQHIYTKLGFKVDPNEPVQVGSNLEDGVENLIPMVYKFSKK